MWLENLKELKEKSKMSISDIAKGTLMSERTIIRIFNGETENPTITSLLPIIKFLKGSFDDVFGDTSAYVGSKSIVELQNTLQSVQADKEHLIAENTILLNKIGVLNAENEIYKMKLRHKEEELKTIYDYYHKLKTE